MVDGLKIRKENSMSPETAPGLAFFLAYIVFLCWGLIMVIRHIWKK